MSQSGQCVPFLQVRKQRRQLRRDGQQVKSQAGRRRTHSTKLASDLHVQQWRGRPHAQKERTKRMSSGRQDWKRALHCAFSTPFPQPHYITHSEFPALGVWGAVSPAGQTLLVPIYFPRLRCWCVGVEIACVFTSLSLGVSIMPFNEFLLSFVSFAHST